MRRVRVPRRIIAVRLVGSAVRAMITGGVGHAADVGHDKILVLVTLAP